MRLRPPDDPVATPPAWCVGWDAAAGTAATKVMSDVWKNEETRFSNLNTRGVAVVSAASVVTALLGFFNKNLLDSTPSQLADGVRVGAQSGLGASVALLVLTIGLVVIGVLRPGRRGVFGGNAITNGQQLTAAEVDKVAFEELALIYQSLVNRTSEKAHWLNLAYLCFFLAVLVAAATSVAVLTQFTPVPG